MNEIRVAGPPDGHLEGGIARGRDFPRVGILLEIFDGPKSREEARGQPGGTAMVGDSHDCTV